MKKVKCVDDIKIVFVDHDGYGDKVLKEVVSLKGLFLLGGSEKYDRGINELTSDAHCYLDESNDFVVKNYFRIEGNYLKAPSPFNPQHEDWYKIDRVKIGQTKLTQNVVNNVHCFLSKSESPIADESQ